MIVKRLVASALVALAVAFPAFAEDGDLKLGFEALRVLNGFIPTGLDLSLTYTGVTLSDAADTKLFLKAGGGYEDTKLLRDQLSGDPSYVIAEGGTGLEFNKPNFQWELAFLQGFSRREDGKNLLEAFAFYRGRFDIYETAGQSASVFADMQGLFGTSVMGGVSYDSRVLSRHRAKEGIYLEATAEWGPAFVNAKTDFWRASGQARGFLPVFDIPTEAGNLFNVYLAGFAGVDYSDGASVPVYVNQSFGGRDLRDSMGNCVRGYGSNAYDSTFKSVANAEVRLVGPAIVIESIVPYLYGFVDCGYYSGFADAATLSGSSGFLASAGGGVAFDVVGMAQLGVNAGYRLVDDTLYGPADKFFWGIKMFLHF